jgi:putative ABC transport system substrate-binding protein
VAHVPKGALFALFPDNTEMGRALGRLAAGPPSPGAGLHVLEQLDTAINIRTANHLGLGVNAGDKRFDMVFPSR